MQDALLHVIDECSGIYCPQRFVNEYMVDNLDKWVDGATLTDDVAIVASGPDHEHYWEAWSTLEMNAVTVDGYSIYQDGGVFLVDYNRIGSDDEIPDVAESIVDRAYEIAGSHIRDALWNLLHGPADCEYPFETACDVASDAFDKAHDEAWDTMHPYYSTDMGFAEKSDFDLGEFVRAELKSRGWPSEAFAHIRTG